MTLPSLFLRLLILVPAIGFGRHQAQFGPLPPPFLFARGSRGDRPGKRALAPPVIHSIVKSQAAEAANSGKEHNGNICSTQGRQVRQFRSMHHHSPGARHARRGSGCACRRRAAPEGAARRLKIERIGTSGDACRRTSCHPWRRPPRVQQQCCAPTPPNASAFWGETHARFTGHVLSPSIA